MIIYIGSSFWYCFRILLLLKLRKTKMLSNCFSFLKRQWIYFVRMISEGEKKLWDSEWGPQWIRWVKFHSCIWRSLWYGTASSNCWDVFSLELRPLKRAYPELGNSSCCVIGPQRNSNDHTFTLHLLTHLKISLHVFISYLTLLTKACAESICNLTFFFYYTQNKRCTHPTFVHLPFVHISEADCFRVVLHLLSDSKNNWCSKLTGKIWHWRCGLKKVLQKLRQNMTSFCNPSREKKAWKCTKCSAQMHTTKIIADYLMRLTKCEGGST